MEYQRIANTKTCRLTKGDNLSHVVVPDQFEDMAVVEIGDIAFARFENLESITLPKNIEKFGKLAFNSCKKLVTIKIPTKVKNIPESCFTHCSNLKVVDFHDGIETIDKNAFFNCGFTKLIIPKKITIIEEEAFAYCPNLSEVVLPSNLTMIKMGAFSGCSLLTNINLPVTLEVIEKDAFYLVSDLTLPYLPNDFIEIQEEAFDSLVEIPDKIDPRYTASKSSKVKLKESKKTIDASNQQKSLNTNNFKDADTIAKLKADPFLWTKLSQKERDSIGVEVLFPDVAAVQNYFQLNEFYGLDGDHWADILGDFEQVSSSLTYEDAVADDEYMKEMEVNSVLQNSFLPIIFLLQDAIPDKSMYKYFNKYCFPKLKTSKDHDKYLSKLEESYEGRLQFLLYLVAVRPVEIFDNKLQLPYLFADYPQD
jgi:hypothetical protein